MPNLFSSWSALALLAANLVPLIGAVFYAWDAKLVLALFWIENLVIGAFNLLKMFSLIVYRKEFRQLFLCFFFILHYGLFCSIHGFFLWDLLELGSMPTIELELGSLAVLKVFADGAAVLIAFVDKFSPIILLGIAALVMSHLVSFIENFILRGEIFDLSINRLMGQPYTQIVILHIGLIVGAIVLEMFESPVWLLAVIVVLKVVVDLVQHRKRHSRALQSTDRIKDI